MKDKISLKHYMFFKNQSKLSRKIQSNFILFLLSLIIISLSKRVDFGEEKKKPEKAKETPKTESRQVESRQPVQSNSKPVDTTPKQSNSVFPPQNKVNNNVNGSVFPTQTQTQTQNKPSNDPVFPPPKKEEKVEAPAPKKTGWKLFS